MKRSRFAQGCTAVALTVYAVSSLACCGGDIVGSTVTRVCASDATLAVLDVYHRDAHGHYRTMRHLQRGDCVAVRGEGVVAPRWYDTGAPLTRVRLDDGRWGRISLASQPATFEYAPHLAFVRAPVETSHALLCVAYIVWVFYGVARRRRVDRERMPRL